MGKARLTLNEARKIIVSAQGFGRFADPLEALHHLGSIQMDTIHVIERAHHHLAWSRLRAGDGKSVGGRIAEMLEKTRDVYEHWSHARAYLPMKDYRFSLPIMRRYRDRKDHWFKREPKVMRQVLERIRAEGPRTAGMLANPRSAAKRNPAGWYERTPEKKACEQLFMAGELMVTRRNGFEIVYDLTERVLPLGIDTRFPSEQEAARHLITTTLRHQGLSTAGQIAHLRPAEKRAAVRACLSEMLEAGEIDQVEIVEAATREPYFSLRSAVEAAGDTLVPDSHLPRFISPFDPLVIHRERAREIFGFDYTLECYTPAKKRKYGYFSLPIVSGCSLVGRIDLKADRASRELLVNGLWWERQTVDLDRTLTDFARFNGCKRVRFTTAGPGCRRPKSQSPARAQTATSSRGARRAKLPPKGK